MKKPVVDYRTFRLHKLGDPQFSHLKLFGGWLMYFLFYFLTENLIPPERCHIMHSVLDDKIPFCELFAIPYCLWYVLIVISLGYFLLYDIENFRNLQVYIIITQVIAMAVYILYPSMQDLRPAVFPRENFLTWVMGLIYASDTPTGVCPSLHVAYSIGIASTWVRKKDAAPVWKAAVVILVCFICVATMFVKQHSSIDVGAGLVMCVIPEFLIFGRGRKFIFRPAAGRRM